MGAGLLYHLAEEGCTDALLIEKGELTSGSTWHAAGQCPSLVGNYNLAKIHAYSNELYPKLEELTGQYVSWHPCGGLRLALTRDDLDWFEYLHGIAKEVGFAMQIVGPSEIKKIHPFLDTEGSIFKDDIIWLAGEGITKGCNPPVNNLFCPDDNVTRGQMAAFMRRALGG